ncbi:MAG: AbrB/MazE/SpoVT family DNA-binding domain-containing protein [Bifidobacteriaceae bacterium]|nr:AbrB/MazE/SpoVT family DNA-binding domain-containing protein [Bifidobacteriaceae bacterium]
MTTLTITSKGQITLKKELLDALGVGPGDKVEAHVAADGSAVLRPVARDAAVDKAAGILARYATKPVTVEEMNRVVAEGWSGRP